MKSPILAAALLVSLAAPAFAQSAMVTPGMHKHGDGMAARRSDRSLHRAEQVLARLINRLEKDQHDYAGHRVTAINDLKAARTELQAAEAADKDH